MRVTVRVEANIRTKEILAAGQGFAQDFARELGELTARYARENVAPGVGPGPHPHRPPPFREHQDTGELQRSIQVAQENHGFLKTARVFTDLEYGLYLEAGWTSQAGRHFRYPWLMPAAMQAQQEMAGIARSTARRWLSGEGRTYAGRQNVNAPLSGTAWPE